MKFGSYVEEFLTPSVYKVVPHSGG
jgi:hypothetical protein